MEELTIAQVAREYGVSRGRVLQLAEAGRIGHKVANRYWIFTRQEVDAYRPRITGKPGRPPKLTLVKTST